MKFKSTALIGIGYWGKIHLKYLRKIKKVSINKIYFNKNKKVLKEKQLKKFNFTHKLKDILNDRSIKFVDIVTPIKTHADLAIKFLKSGKRVLVEKPLLMSQKQEKKISKLNSNLGNLTVSYPYLFSKSLNFVQKILKEKKIGKLRYIEMNIQQCGRFMQYGVNHLLGPHAISVLSIFYDINKIEFKLHKVIKKNNKCETSVILCFFKNKLISTINLSLNYTDISSKKVFVFYCDNGTVICDLNNSKKTVISYYYKRVIKKNYVIAKKFHLKSNFFDEKNNMRYVLESFLNKKKSLNNFKLTKKINFFLKNGK